MCQVLQPVESKVKQAKNRGQIGLNQRPGSVRDQYLPAVPSSRNPSGPVNVDTHIVAAGEMALSSMQAHPDADSRGKRRICQPPLNMAGGIHGTQRAPKHHKERIPLRADFRPFVFPDHLSEDAIMLLQKRNVAVTKFFEKASRPLDIGEQKRDGAAW